MASTGKIAEVMFDKALETYEHQDQLLDLCTFIEPEADKMQNSGNVIWRPVQQHAPIIDGWDLTGEETDIIEETYPAILGTPKNDFVEQRADDMRDTRFWERRGEQSGRRQATELNSAIANLVKNQGSLFYTSATSSGYEFVAEAQALLNERQTYHSSRCFILNDRDTLTYASDLAGRQTVQGRPEETWKSGQIGANVAEFDVYTGSYLPTITGGASPDATVTGNQSFAPSGGTVDPVTLAVTNVDYREAVIPVSDSSGYNIGDKVSFDGVNSVGLADKQDTGQAMTFTIVGKPDGTSVKVFPKPIAADDPALSTLEKAYANVNTRILDGAVMARLNTAAGKTNLFWDKGAVEVLGGTIPAQLFKQFDGMKVISQTMKNGQTMYMVYDGDLAKMSFRFRIFTWWGLTCSRPDSCGAALSV